jgi:3alpha(or 20beta)-hydroxysteroid dehydrogenase
MGKSHVRHFAAEGASVVFGDVLDGTRVAEGLENCRFVKHDVTSEPDWAAAVATAVETFGRLDILVNNAGILRHSPIPEMSLQSFREVIEVNLIGTWLGIKSVIEPMRASGGGSIVNISSIEGFAGAAGLSAYSASKFGVRGITRSAAQELGQHGIRVNSVHPGGIMTRMVMESAGAFTTVDPLSFLKSMPISRFGEPAEISRLVLFLASDESTYCTGSEFVADGGILSGPGY